jgi:hypothetical protein
MANFNYLFRLCLCKSIENEQGERGIFFFPTEALYSLSWRKHKTKALCSLSWRKHKTKQEPVDGQSINTTKRVRHSSKKRVPKTPIDRKKYNRLKKN